MIKILVTVLAALLLILHPNIHDRINDGLFGLIMRQTGSTVCEVRVNGWCNLAAGDWDEAKVAGLIADAMLNLGIEENAYRQYMVEANGQRIYRAEAIEESRQICVALMVPWQTAAKRSNIQPSFVVTIKCTPDYSARDALLSNLRRVFHKTGEHPQITTCLVGWLDGKLVTEDWSKMFIRVGQAVFAIPVDTFVQPDLVNVAYYSPLLAEYVQIGNKPVNINMAMRYSPGYNRTYVIVGSPVIIGEY